MRSIREKLISASTRLRASANELRVRRGGGRLVGLWPSNGRQALLDFNRSLTLIVDPEALMSSIAARISELFGTDRLIILAAVSDGGIYTVTFSRGYSGDELKSAHPIQHGRLAKWLLTNETAMVVGRDPGVFEYLTEAEQEMLTSLDVRVCAPLLALNRLTGLILLSSSHAGWRPSEDDLRLLQLLMNQAGMALENAYLHHQERDRLLWLYRAERLAAAGQLAASVAHEIRNPLTAIRSTVQYLLADFEEGSPKRSLVEGVIAEADRIDRTVDRLLSLTRRAEFNPSRIALGPLIDQSLLMVGTQARNQSVEVVWQPPSADAYVMGDESQLKELLLNLLLNALQAMTQGGRLKVEMGRRRSDSLRLKSEMTWAQVSLADTGCGIPPENLDKVFDPLFTTKQEGTGLGLSISYAIVRHHGGELAMKSREGEGTTVTIRLPLVR